jgi:acyl-CoA reductase-like NAD-dependent aldehyde dehydrogenase
VSGRLLSGDGADQIQCFDPRSGDPTATVDCTPVDAIPQMLQVARAAQQEWWSQGLKRRKWALDDIHKSFLSCADEFAQLLAEECGRPAGEAWTSEILANHHLFKFWLGNIDDLLTAFPLSLSPIDYPGKRGRVVLEPKGVIALITPWNLPLAIPLRGLIPALLAGNSVILKPSEHTPRVGALIARICAEHLLPGVVQLVQGAGAQGAALVDAAPDQIFFTGSVGTGRAVASSAVAKGTRVALELGGKDAALVMEDADLERAAAGITWAAFGFSGQNCAAVERCFVHESIYADFLARVSARSQALRPLLDLGPLVTEAQLQTVKSHIREAVEAGARIETGGNAPGPGFYHEPTILTGLKPEMKIMREETFGPVLPILPYSDLDEAITQINSSDFGLTTSVWTRNLALGEALASSFECGVVTVNNHSFTGALPDGAWCGVKNTGDGVTNSRFALYEMVRPRTILVDSMKGPREMWWYPYNDALTQVARSMVKLASPGESRLDGVKGALTGLLNRWKEEN